MNSNLDQILDVAMAAALSAGEEIKRIRSADSLDVTYKGAHNLVTSADLAAEKIVVERIKAAFPGHHFLSEERNPELAPDHSFDNPLWIIDPVDGTTNYAHGHLQVGISIAYMEKRAVQAGVVHSPFQSETFTAIKGRGARLNGHPIKVSGCSSLSSALIATGFPYEREDLRQIVKRIELVLKSCRDIRRLGAASLDICWVAMGRIDGFYETLSAWDIAAGCLIASEAGAEVGFIEEQPEGSKLPRDLYAEGLVVATPAVYGKLRELLRRA